MCGEDVQDWCDVLYDFVENGHVVYWGSTGAWSG
jgi:hypothetical protein